MSGPSRNERGGRRRVAVHASSRAWRQAFIIYVANHAADVELTVVREARSTMEASPVVVVADLTATWLDAPLVGLLHRHHIGVVLVASASEQAGSVWRAADATVDPAAGPEAIVSAVQAVSTPGPSIQEEDDPLAPWDQENQAPASTMDGPVAPVPGLGMLRPDPDTTSPATGTLSVLTGPQSAPVHEVAVGMAAACATRHPAVLVDADQSSPRLARRLGYDLTPNVLGALERQRSGRGWPGEVTTVARRGGGPRVLFHSVVGVPPGEPSDLNPAEMGALLTTLRSAWDEVLVVTDSRLLATAVGPARHRVLVGAPGRMGMLEVLDWLADHASVGAGGAGWVVVLTGSPSDHSHRSQLADLLYRHTPPGLIGDVVGLPPDRRTAEAEWQGELLGRGPFTQAIEQLVARLLPTSLGVQRVRTSSTSPVGREESNAGPNGVAGAKAARQGRRPA